MYKIPNTHPCKFIHEYFLPSGRPCEILPDTPFPSANTFFTLYTKSGLQNLFLPAFRDILPYCECTLILTACVR